MIILYYREYIESIFNTEGMAVKHIYKPLGCVVAIDKDHIGWSLCGNGDHFSYKMAKTIAFGRAYVEDKARKERIKARLPYELQGLYELAQKKIELQNPNADG